MTVLAHTREGVVVRGRDLYDKWARALPTRSVLRWKDLPDDVRAAWDALADDVQEVIEHV